MKLSIGNFLLSLFLGMILGAVIGSFIDRILDLKILSLPLLKEYLLLEFYIIKIEIQFTPASLIGLVVTGYLVIKRGK